MFYKVVY